MKRKRLCTLVLAVALACMPMSVFATDGDAPAKTMAKAKAKAPSNESTYEKYGYYRVYGDNRYLTAAAIAGFVLGYAGNDKAPNVIVASGQNYPDALGAGYVCNEYSAPIVLTSPAMDEDIADFVSNYLLRESTTDDETNFAIVMGGSGAVSNNFCNILDSYMSTSAHTNQYWDRWEGSNRYETNLETLKNADVQGEEILICSGEGFADSLSASGTGLPIMLVGKSMTSDQIEFLKSCGTQKLTIIGGTGAVSPTVESQLKRISGIDVSRISGSNRYETSYLIAREYFPDSQSIVLAYGENFPDGLAGCSVSFVKDAPMLLCSTRSMSYVKRYVNENNANDAVVLGGPALISDEAVISLGL